MAELTLEMLRTELAPMRADIHAIQIVIRGLPLLGQAIETLRHDVRTLRAAINDMARTEMTAGEAEALHHDLDTVITKQRELEARIAALEQ